MGPTSFQQAAIREKATSSAVVTLRYGSLEQLLPLLEFWGVSPQQKVTPGSCVLHTHTVSQVRVQPQLVCESQPDLSVLHRQMLCKKGVLVTDRFSFLTERWTFSYGAQDTQTFPKQNSPDGENGLLNLLNIYSLPETIGHSSFLPQSAMLTSVFSSHV